MSNAVRSRWRSTTSLCFDFNQPTTPTNAQTVQEPSTRWGWVLQSSDGSMFGMAHSPFTIGGGAAVDVLGLTAWRGSIP